MGNRIGISSHQELQELDSKIKPLHWLAKCVFKLFLLMHMCRMYSYTVSQ